jgi:hypothetical protein
VGGLEKVKTNLLRVVVINSDFNEALWSFEHFRQGNDMDVNCQGGNGPM